MQYYPPAVEVRGGGTKRTICKFWQQGQCERGAQCTWAHGAEDMGKPQLESPVAGYNRPGAGGGKGWSAPPPQPVFGGGWGGKGGKGGLAAGKGGPPVAAGWGKGGGGKGKGWGKEDYGWTLMSLPMGGKLEPSAKKTICKFWAEGLCSRGEECTWAHGREEMGQPIEFSRPPPSQQWQPAPSWGKGGSKGWGGSIGGPGGLLGGKGYYPGPGAPVARTPSAKKTLCKFWQAGACEKGDACTWAHGEEELGQPLAGAEELLEGEDGPAAKRLRTE